MSEHAARYRTNVLPLWPDGTLPSHPGPRTLEEEFLELGQDAPWLVQCRRGIQIKQQTRLGWGVIARTRLFISPSQFRRWRVTLVRLHAEGKL